MTVGGHRGERNRPGPAALRRHALLDRRERAIALVRSGNARLAVQALSERAAAAAAGPEWSVTDTAFVPPGGGPNDYVHIAEYAWPDPEDPLRPWQLRDGRVNPAARRIAADGRRLAGFAEAVDTLASSASILDVEPHGVRAEQLVRAWFLDPATAMEPSLRFAVCIPGSDVPATWGLARLHPLLDVLDAVALLDQVVDIEGVAAGVADWSSLLLEWLLASELFAAELERANNHSVHAIGIALGLAVFVDDARSGGLARQAAEVIRAQVDDDGTQPAELARSRSYFYCGYNALAMLRAAELAWCCGVDLFGVDDAPRRAVDALLPALVDPRRWPRPSVEPSDAGRHGDLLVRAAASWPGNERIRRALDESRIRPGPADPVWLRAAMDPARSSRPVAS